MPNTLFDPNLLAQVFPDAKSAGMLPEDPHVALYERLAQEFAEHQRQLGISAVSGASADSASMVANILNTPLGYGEKSTHPLAESLRAQAETSHKGFEATIGYLHDANVGKGLDGHINSETFNVLLEQQLSHWGEAGPDGKSVLDFIKDQKEKHLDTDWTLVAVPVLPKGVLPLTEPHKIIRNAFKAFVKDMPNAGTKYIDPQYCGGYTVEEVYGVSSTDATVGVRFELVPTQFTQEVPHGTVADQKTSLEAFQRANPSANLHIPSPLAQLTRLVTLKEQNGVDSLMNNVLTFIRNIDLPIVNGSVPHSVVSVNGDVFVDVLTSIAFCEARVAAG